MSAIDPLQGPVTWYKIPQVGEQVGQWDFQNKGRSRWTGTSCIVLEVPLCNLLTSMCDFVPCDRIMQRAYLALSAHRVHIYCLKPWLSSISFNTKLLSEMEQHYLGFLFGAENFMDLIDLVFSLAPSWCVSESSLGDADRLLAFQWNLSVLGFRRGNLWGHWSM